MTNQDTAKTQSILLADDSKLVRFTAAKVLGDEFTVVQAENGEQAWEILQANSDIQLVLSDLQMPKLDGFGLLKNIRNSESESVSNLPVIIITGAENSDGSKEEAIALGATDFISKPFDHAHLIARVRAHIGHQQQTRTLMERVYVDNVTGLLTKDGFEKRLAKDAAFVSRHQHSLTVMLIQLNDYRTLFEAFGRAGYDAVMRKVAQIFKSSIRQEDTAARAGLAQFILSLPMADPASANILAQRFTSQVEALEIKVKGKTWRLSLSIGVFTAHPGSTIDAASALDGAHTALEKTLQQGDGQCTVVSAAPPVKPVPISLDKLLFAIEKTGRLPEGLPVAELVKRLQPLLALLPESVRRQLLS
ncbi:diguanylate cyclase domain-containing protein [Halioxenophilus sp. WMMB6]|uniref:GGDEF domain-containing response regulator n=1 Tax=Halioxenophilus sp. WMMB6 TaxID=3073815 RepID=UPI00295E5F70|nr:diguanylate cyclase [Halioxenophilus sp. WMMB6]